MKCTLRKWNVSDASALAKVLSSESIFDNLRDGMPYPYTEADGMAYIAGMRLSEEDGCFSFAVCFGGEIVGCVSVVRGNDIYRHSGELGYYLSEEYRGRGIMTDAVREICDTVFQNSDILRIHAEVFAKNKASQRVLLKCGFEYEGTKRKGAVKNGELRDVLLYAKLRSGIA